MYGPRDVATEHTLSFLKPHLADKRWRILEIGCGLGDLAAALARQGHAVVGLESSVVAVESARAKGVDARHADLLDFTTAEKFDCAIFTRSLHHLPSLDEALRHVGALLQPGGLCLVEDFALERPDHATLEWYYGLAEVLDPANVPTHASLERHWEEEHRETPPLHRGDVMREAVRDVLGGVEETSCPYLYRSFLPYLERKDLGYERMRAIFGWESRLIASAAIRPVGMRLVAKKA